MKFIGEFIVFVGFFVILAAGVGILAGMFTNNIKSGDNDDGFDIMDFD
jgi:hypothetical protein